MSSSILTTTDQRVSPVPQAAPPMANLPPVAEVIVDRAIESMTRKLVAGFRNKATAVPNAKSVDVKAETAEVLKAASAQSVMEVANRGQAWKEMLQKTFSHGISSLSTIKFDGEFTISNGQPDADLKTAMPDKPGVYVVFDKDNKPVYVGDSGDMRARWRSGHLNEFRQGQKDGNKDYKLAEQMTEGCTVRFIETDSKETAAAIEAHLIATNRDTLSANSREELKAEQGTRSNKEAKKMKDAASSAARLAVMATGEAFKNVGYDVFERVTVTAIKATKDELVDVVAGNKQTIKARIERVIKKILAVLRDLVDKPMQIMRGIVEFIVNALSKTIAQVYNLARNLFDLANNAWQIYQGAKGMSREELVRRITETIVISGSLVMWDSLDLMLEKWLVAQTGGALLAFAPYISATVCAVGFGISTHALQAIVTRIIDACMGFHAGHMELIEGEKAACEQLIIVAENELAMLGDLRDYIESEVVLVEQMVGYAKELSVHEPIKPIDLSDFKIPV